jgi:catechol 2,3-dioxygenase-like lactoylglutathione lyase family enzyme
MLDHLGIPVIDYARSKAFYLKALAPLGHGLVMEVTPEQTGHGYSAGFGSDKPGFWIAEADTIGRVHVAFTAANRAAVDAFHAAAIAAGAIDNGSPGPRPQYHPGYYGAFVLDPDGHNIEAAYHAPEP